MMPNSVEPYAKSLAVSSTICSGGHRDNGDHTLCDHLWFMHMPTSYSWCFLVIDYAEIIVNTWHQGPLKIWYAAGSVELLVMSFSMEMDYLQLANELWLNPWFCVMTLLDLYRPYAYDVTEGRPGALGSNVALPRAPSPSMQPAGQPMHAIPPGWPGPAHWLRGWAPMRSASTTRARSTTSLDPQYGVVVMETWRQCIRSIESVTITWCDDLWI